MGLKDWARQKNRELHRQALEDRDSHLWHSSAYHRYFEGYTEHKELGPGGRERIVRIYTGTWIRQDLTRGRSILLRAGYVLLFLTMVAGLLLAGRMQQNSGTAFYVAIPELVTVCGLAWMGYTLAVNYLFLPEKMTIHDFRASSRALQRGSMLLLICFLLDAAMALLEYLIRGRAAAVATAIRPAFLFVAGALCAGVMHLLERHVPYREIENTARGKPGGIPIENE